MKKFTKWIALTAAAMIAALSLTGCGGGSGSSKEIDVAKVADELNSKTVTTDKLSETKTEMLGTIYFFEDGQVEESKVYMSGAATANEVAVVKCKDEDAAKAVTELFKNRVSSQKDLFSSYNPDEAAKLDDAIVKSAGSYAVLCVCDDYDAANSILKDAGF